MPTNTEENLTEDWLQSVGFKWHQLERQPNKHWLLWLGDALGKLSGFEDLGIEVAQCDSASWFCWLRSDSAGRYHRFIHLRHIITREDLIRIIEAITGQGWDPENNLYGSMRTPLHAKHIREQEDRLDRQILKTSYPHSDIEKDDSMGGPLPEHLAFFYGNTNDKRKA
jgi:hypothetical protein